MPAVHAANVPHVSTEVVMGPPHHKREHFVTRGEKKFDRLAYRDIGYIINALMSVGAVYWVERTHSGQRGMNHFIEWTKKTLPSVNSDTAKLLATKSFFLSGGFAVLAPMKLLEDHKADLVEKWNKEFYGAQEVATNPDIIQSQKEVRSAPTQGWASIGGSRILALGPFYATVGLLWERKSILSKLTNPELRALGKDGAKALEESDPQAFSQIAGKGVYFDRPIAAASRMIGKGWAKVTGNQVALAKLEEMEARYPGMIKQGPVASLERDPNHSAVPYYFISEAITSGMVAWGVYALSRVLAPIIGKKHTVADAEMAPVVAAADTSRPSQFYHGTQTAIHLLPEPFLDPKLANAHDEGDPAKPHVFVTPNKLLAKVFALKIPDVVAISTSDAGANIVFASEPKNLHGGWVYTCPENPQRPFEQTVARGQPTGKWVSYEKVAVTQPEFVPGLRELCQQDGLQTYVLKKGVDTKAWMEARSNAAYSGQLDAFTQAEVASGNLRHLNREWHIDGPTVAGRAASSPVTQIAADSVSHERAVAADAALARA